MTKALDAFRVLCPSPLPVTIEMHEMALKIAEKHGCTIYDALVVSAALAGGCTILYSEDLRDGQTIDGQLTIRNPFVGWISVPRFKNHLEIWRFPEAWAELVDDLANQNVLPARRVGRAAVLLAEFDDITGG